MTKQGEITIICPATKGEIDASYCDGNCINCPWMTVEVEPSIEVNEKEDKC